MPRAEAENAPPRRAVITPLGASRRWVAEAGVDLGPHRVDVHLERIEQPDGTAIWLSEERAEHARRAVAALRPESLDGASLPVAMADFYLKWTDTETDVIALRVVQEALANVAKHAQAEEVTVTLAYGRGRLRVSVHDDGRGFDSSKSLRPNEFGLATMRERVASVGGNLSIASEAGRGTTVTAILPNSRERE